MMPTTETQNLIKWILAEGEPWARYRTFLDLLGRSEDDELVKDARTAMIDHPQVRTLIQSVAKWPGPALTRHNDAQHPIHILSTLIEFGISQNDDGLESVLSEILAHQSREGAFQIQLNIPTARGGTGSDEWAWMLCDSPVILHALLGFGCGELASVKAAIAHLTTLLRNNGWPCAVSPQLGKFRGPGRKEDPCPYANLVSLKALSLVPCMVNGDICRVGTEALLGHWEQQKQRKIYMFGIGGDFRKLKYPFIWYDILHVVEILSRFPHVYEDRRFLEMLNELEQQADSEGRYMARSAYRAWGGWEFADKKHPSPWLTFLVLRIRKRLERLAG
jgi:hypothetical protein